MRRKSRLKHIKVRDLASNTRGINIFVKVLEIKNERKVFSRRDRREHRVAEALVGDETGVIILSLWDDNIDKVKEGDVIEIRNGYVSTFKNQLRLNIGMYGSMKITDLEINSINLSNNLSKRK